MPVDAGTMASITRGAPRPAVTTRSGPVFAAQVPQGSRLANCIDIVQCVAVSGSGGCDKYAWQPGIAKKEQMNRGSR